MFATSVKETVTFAYIMTFHCTSVWKRYLTVRLWFDSFFSKPLTLQKVNTLLCNIRIYSTISWRLYKWRTLQMVNRLFILCFFCTFNQSFWMEFFCVMYWKAWQITIYEVYSTQRKHILQSYIYLSLFIIISLNWLRWLHLY